MKTKFAKALAENIATIAGNVAHIALIDAGVIDGETVPPNRSEAYAKVDKCKANIASLLAQPGCHPDAND